MEYAHCLKDDVVLISDPCYNIRAYDVGQWLGYCKTFRRAIIVKCYPA